MRKNWLSTLSWSFVPVIENLQRKLFHSSRVRLVDFIFNTYINGKGSTHECRKYQRLVEHLRNFEQQQKHKIYSDSFDDETAHSWVEYLRTTTNLKKNIKAYRQSTLRMFHQKTISVLYRLARSCYAVRIESLCNIRIRPVRAFAVYLTEQEVESLLELELTPAQSKVRDLFVLGCCTALRFSDIIRLTANNFNNDTIGILTKKTKVRVEIPIHHLIRRIILRNNGFSFLGYNGSASNFNKTIKAICQKANITQNVLVERVEKGEIVRSSCEKWKLVSSHTARRTGATNMFLHNIEPYRIMMITGHTSETIFFQYLRISEIENANFLLSNSFFSGLPTSVTPSPQIPTQNLVQINNFSTTNYVILPPLTIEKPSENQSAEACTLSISSSNKSKFPHYIQLP